MNIRGEGCNQPTVATPTMLGMSIRQVMSTTTTVGTVIGFSRLFQVQDSVGTRLSVPLLGTLRQGVLALLQNGENNSALYTVETQELTIAEEGQLFNDLFDSMLKRKKGVMWKPQVKAWVINGAENIRKLTSSIIEGAYTSRIPLSIPITYPKKRIVKAIPFRDRIWQGYLNDKFVYPLMTRSFIYGNMASQLGKGTDKARELFKTYLWNHFTHYGTEGYVLQIDIHSYYQTIPRNLALELFKLRLPSFIYPYVEEVLITQYPDSFFAGSQMVQILGIAYLDELDHFIKEQLHIRHYIRYQDDFLLLSPSYSQLSNALYAIEKRLSALSLSINHKKTHIQPITLSIAFLGFVWQLNKNGDIYIKVNPKRIKEIKRRIKKHPESIPSYIAFLNKAKSFKLINRILEEKYA